MNKMINIIITLLSLAILTSCAPSAYRSAGGGLAVAVDPWGDTSYSSIRSEADRACRYLGRGTSKNLKEVIKSDGIANAHWSFDCTGGSSIASGYSSGTNSSSSTSYTNNNTNKYYSNSMPVMFYDKASNSMRECAGQIIAGTCSRYAPYNASSYSYDTLYYNPSNGAMQRCANQSLGRCLSFRPQPVIASNDQLFYNPRTRSMAKCLNSNNKGQCLSFGVSPTARADTGSYIVDDPSNPYYKKVPQTPQALINLGNNMLSGNCTLGLNC